MSITDSGLPCWRLTKLSALYATQCGRILSHTKAITTSSDCVCVNHTNLNGPCYHIRAAPLKAVLICLPHDSAVFSVAKLQ